MVLVSNEGTMTRIAPVSLCERYFSLVAFIKSHNWNEEEKTEWESISRCLAKLLEFKLSAWCHLLLLSKLKALQKIKKNQFSGKQQSKRIFCVCLKADQINWCKNQNQCFQKGNESGSGNDNLEQQYLHPAKCSSSVVQIHAFRKEFDKYVDPACQRACFRGEPTSW